MYLCYFRFDKNLGGLELTLRLREHLAKAFNEQKKTKTDVFSNDRAMGKLFKEAERLKKVLSANIGHTAQVQLLTFSCLPLQCLTPSSN